MGSGIERNTVVFERHDDAILAELDRDLDAQFSAPWRAVANDVGDDFFEDDFGVVAGGGIGAAAVERAAQAREALLEAAQRSRE